MESQSNEGTISRRDFLGRFGRGTLGAAATAFLPQIPTPTLAQAGWPEKAPTPETRKAPSTLILDIFDLESLLNHEEEVLLTGKTETVQGILQRIGVKEASSLTGLQEGVPQSEEETKILMLEAARRYWSQHGELVNGVRQKAQTLFHGQEKPVNKTSLVDTVTFVGMERDKDGNPSLKIKVDSQKMAEKIAQSDSRIVNMSFEMGEMGFKYSLYDAAAKDENALDTLLVFKYKIHIINKSGKTIYEDAQGREIPQEEIDKIKAELQKPQLREPERRQFWPIDGYLNNNPERTYANLSLMAEMAIKFPDKIFVVAAGNPYKDGAEIIQPQINQAVARLIQEEKWPDNLFMVGVFGDFNGLTTVASLGADFYVHKDDLDKELGVLPAASFATPVVTEVISKIIETGITDPREIRKKLKSMCTNESEGNYLWVLNFQKIKEKFFV